MVTTIITAMAAYSNERVAAIVISVLYRMLTHIIVRLSEFYLIPVIKLFINYLTSSKSAS